MPFARMRLGGAAVIAAMLLVSIPDQASAQTVSALGDPQAPLQKPAKPMTPERIGWLKKRCAQLVAYYDYWAVGRGENSDGPRNHTRIGAAIDCERANYRGGIDHMARLLVVKSFECPKVGTPAMEPEDIEAPDITNPTRPWYWM